MSDECLEGVRGHQRRRQRPWLDTALYQSETELLSTRQLPGASRVYPRDTLPPISEVIDEVNTLLLWVDGRWAYDGN